MPPNFFIVGAPKCGTTAVFSYLRTHPAVFMPGAVKEPHYFSPEFWSLDSIVTPEAYARLFEGATERHLAVGEASTGYILSDVALNRIRSYNPSAKIVLMLRNPVEMAESLYDEMRYHWMEPLPTFEAAWGAQKRRRVCGPPKVATETDSRLQYSRCCSVGSLYQKALDVFSSGQVHVILFDDFKTRPRDVYLRLLSFLDLADDGRLDFPPVNARRVHRYPRLTRLFMKPPEPFYSLKKRIRNALGLQAAGWGWRFISQFSRAAPKQPLRPDFAEELQRHFAPEVDRLEKLLGRSLAAWKSTALAQRSAA